MANLLEETEEVVEGRVIRIATRPISFEQFLELAEEQLIELEDGVVVEKPMMQLDHELCSAWLYQLMGPYVQEKDLGLILGSRIMVKTDDFGGRMPDLLFVKKEHSDIVRQRAVYGAPDLVIEIISPSNRPSELVVLEADYHRLGVPELIFIDMASQQIKKLQRGERGYDEKLVTTDMLTFSSIKGLSIPADWILKEPRPGIRKTLNALFS